MVPLSVVPTFEELTAMSRKRAIKSKECLFAWREYTRCNSHENALIYRQLRIEEAELRYKWTLADIDFQYDNKWVL